MPPPLAARNTFSFQVPTMLSSESHDRVEEAGDRQAAIGARPLESTGRSRA